MMCVSLLASEVWDGYGGHDRQAADPLHDQDGWPPQIEAEYQPLTADGREVWGEFQAFLPLDGEPALKSRCEALVRAVTSLVAEREVDIDGTVTHLSPQLALLTV